MEKNNYRSLLVCLFTSLLLIGCQMAPVDQSVVEKPVNLDTTVGNLAQLIQFEAVPVRGFGIVAGLNGTGSAECPPALRRELEKYIRQQLPNDIKLNPRKFLESTDTAVVEISGIIPALASPGDTFDVRIRPLSRTQTTSLNGGYLYTAQLKEMSRLIRYDQFAKTLATAQGQIFQDPFTAEQPSTQWYVLGGGIVRNQVKISLALFEPSLIAANAIRNRINERFGANTATALSSSEIRLSIPPIYTNQKFRFLQMVQTLYLSEDPMLLDTRIQSLINQLKTQTNTMDAEIALEAIGNASLDTLAPLLKSADPTIRFVAARCMLRIGSNRSLSILSEICKNPSSRFRIPAINAVGENASKKVAEPILISVLTDTDLKMRLAAYEHLLNLKSFVISRNVVGQNFVVDRIFCGGPKIIYVFLKEEPRIALFGSPITCRPDVFLQSEDQSIMINARPENKFLSVSRKHPRRHRTVGPIHAGRDISSLVRTLGENAEVEAGKAVQPGLSIPYDKIIKILKKITDNQIIRADFQTGQSVEDSEILQRIP